MSPLMPHQREAVDWLKNQKIGLLAHEPGVGKTLTALTTIQELGCKRVLIVAPAPLLMVWQEEAQKWYKRDVIILRGPAVKRRKLIDAALYENGWYVIGYEALRQDAKVFKAMKFDAIICDESYKFASPTAKVTKAILGLQAPVRIALNGTPVSNGWQDLWSVCTWLMPASLYGNFYRFRSIHAILHPMFPAITGWRGVEEIRRRIDPLISWKKKTDVLKDLPPITEQTIPVQLSAAELKVYEQIKRELRLEILGEDSPISNALVKLLRLRQTTNGLFAFGENETSSKIDTLIELLGSIPPDAKVIVFSGFKETINQISKRLELKHVKITGDNHASEREEAVSIFRHDPKTRVLLGSDAMAYGLNLQEASYVVNVDLPWSYAKYEQRIGRAWRAGQQKPVTVWNLQAEKSVDEKVAEILSRKIKTAEDAAGISRQDIEDILK